MKRLFLHFILFFSVISSASAGEYRWKYDSYLTGDTAKNAGPGLAFVCNPSADSDTLFCPMGANTLTLIITGTNLICNSDNSGTATVTVTGGVAPYTYQWTPSNQSTSSATGFSAGNKSVEVWDNTGITSCIISIDLCEPTAMFVSIIPPAPVTSCFGVCDGQATASVPAGSGTPPYTYSWNSSPVQTTALATGLCSGAYTVTVTDANGCIKPRNANIGQPPVLSHGGTSVNVTCFGLCNGSACIAPSGGTPPYTYSWSTGSSASCLSALCAPLSLTCTVTDSKGCVSVYSTTITQPPLLTVTATGTNLLCNSVCDGSVTATAGGGVPNYTYSWAPGGATTSAVTGLCANNYTVTLTDANGCVKTATVAVTQPGAITANPTGTNLTCFGQCNGTVNINPSGGTSPYTYSWAPGGCTTSACSNLCSGTYTVTVTDASGCTKTGTVTLTEPTLLTASTSKADVTCFGVCNGSASVTAGGGTPNYTYSWAPGGATTSAISARCAGNYTVTVTDSRGCTATDTLTINSPAAIALNNSSTSASCSGVCDGGVSSSVTGGTAPYTYSWAPGGVTTSAVTGLCAGNYTLTLRDANGCQATQTVTVSQPNPFSASVSSATPNPLNCNGDCDGTVATTVNGGTPLYTYLWSNGQTTASLTGLCAGVYSLAVRDANNCLANTSITFLQPTTMTVTISSSNPLCSTSCNGSAAAVVGGGTPVYTFSWLPGGQTTSGINGQCGGSYTITVRDSKGCVNTQTVTLTAPTALTASASVVSNVLCAGQCNGSAASTPSGGTAPYTYSWTGGQTTSAVTGLCAGSFSVTVTDSKGCTSIDQITITQPSVLSSSILSTTSSCSLCNGTAAVSTSGGTSPYTFLWTPSGQTTSAAVGLCIGNYTVIIADSNNCQNTIVATINPVVTLTLTVSGTSVSCPGACDGIATATPFGGGAPYTYAWSTAPLQTTQSASGLCPGTYSVSVADANGCISSDTVVFTNPAPLGVNMSSSVASCGICNGSATAAPSGGTGAYTYAWLGFPVQTTATATGLCSGNYTVTLKDANNCSLTNTVSVGSIPSITNSPSVTLAACGSSDGAICASPAGGTAPYTYLWSPGGATTACITGLPAGIDTVIVYDAAGCIDTMAIPVGNVGAATLTVTSQANPTCTGDCDGSIAVSSGGANPPFTYFWSPGGQTTTAVSGLCAGTYILQVANSLSCTAVASITLTDPAQMSSSPVVTNVSCMGGTNGNICLSPSGGVAPYTYTWSNGQATSCATGLSAGTYTVIMADAGGCDDTLLIPVTEPALLTVTVSATDVTCNGNCDGTATATVSGGTTLYTYTWSTGAPIPSIVGLCPNSYSLTVTDNNGCTATGSVSITQPSVLTTTISSVDALCNGDCNGTSSILASGGTTAYSYSWLPGGETTSAVTGLCAGNYAATVTDNKGCVSSRSVTISQPAAISATVSSTNASCAGGCDGTASVNISGGTGTYTYLWSPGGATTSSATGLCTGSYTVTIADSNACQNTQIVPISAPALLQANVNTTSPLCFGGCNGSATSSPIGGTGTYTYSWNTSPAQSTAAATGLCAGNYTLTLSDANGCAINQQVTIAAPPPLTQANGVAGATCASCNGSISVIPAGGTSPYTFIWNTGATAATITGLCAGVYTDTVMDANGCISLDTIPVSNTSGPAITVAGTNISCFGACDGVGSVTSAIGDGPPWVYSWFPGSQSTPSITGLCPGQYFATVTDTFGCKTISPVNITQPGPLASNPAVTNANCIGICNGSIALSPGGGTLPYTFTWLPGNQTTQNITSQCAGNYTVTIRDANNCVLTTTATIGQNTILTSAVTSTNDSCNTACKGTAAITVSGGTAPYTYAWSSTVQTTSAVTGLCAGTTTITVTDAGGCVRIDSVVISQPLVLAANISAAGPLCNGSCDGSASASPAGGTPPYTYLWTGGATTSSVTGLCAASYTLTLSDTNNCSTVVTFSLLNPPAVSSTHTVTSASCSNTCDGSISITPSGGTGIYTFTWFPGSQTTQNITGLCAGIDSVLITDTNGCTFTDTMTVGITTVVTAATGNDTAFCAGGTANLCSGSINAISVGWYQLPAWALVGNTNCVSVSPAAGVTSFALIAMNGLCSDTDTVAVTVNNYPVLTATSDSTICQGDSISLCAAGANAYQWYGLPGWTPTVTGSCMKVSPPTGTTCFGVIGMNAMCSDTDSVCVTVLAMPIAIASNDTAFCFGDSVTLCSNSLNAVSVGWYSTPSWTQIATTTCTSFAPPAGMNDFTLIAYNGTCSDTDTVAVNVYSTPSVNAGTGVTILAPSSTVLNGSGSGTYLWMPSSGLSCTTCANPTATPSVNTTYTLMVTDVNGCTATDTVRVTVIVNVVPNDGLSPNDDGLNDIWKIPGIEVFPDAVVEVYNRWGELLFRSVGYKTPWDATYNGKQLPVGTYYYIINLNSEWIKEPITGPITILR